VNAAPSRLYAFAALALGVGVIAVMVAFYMLPEVKAAVACGRATSLVEFQQARSMDDLIAVFSAPGGHCRAPMVAAMDAQNQLDLKIFIPVYALFLLASVAVFERRIRGPLFIAAAAAIVVGVVGDVVETLVQLRITDDIEGARPHFSTLAFGYTTKYLGLAAHAAVFAAIAFLAGRRFWWLTLAALAPPLVVAANAFGYALPTIAGFAPFWGALLVAAGLVAFRPSAPSTEQEPAGAPPA